MRAGRGAAVGVVTKGVDVHAALGIGIMAGDVPADSGRRRLQLLLEGDDSRDLGVTADDSNCRVEGGQRHGHQRTLLKSI